MGIDAAGHMQLGPADHQSFFPPFDDMDILIRVDLFRRAFGTVPFGIGHGPDHHIIFLLDHDQPFFKSLQVIGFVLLIDLKGHGIDGIDPVQAHTALKAGSGFLSQNAQQLDLFDQIFHILMDMGKAADDLTG